MSGQQVEVVLLTSSAALLVGSQVGLWKRSARASPQATWMTAVTQLSALGVLALYLDQAGLRPVAVVLAALASTAFVGLTMGTANTRRVAQDHQTTWLAAHRKGVHSAVVVVEAFVAAFALVVTVGWAAQRFNGDFNGNADSSLCRVLGDSACR
jgi:hypothetical protein